MRELMESTLTGAPPARAPAQRAAPATTSPSPARCAGIPKANAPAGVEGLDRVADRRGVLLGARWRLLGLLLGPLLVALAHPIDVHGHRLGLGVRLAGYPSARTVTPPRCAGVRAGTARGPRAPAVARGSVPCFHTGAA